MIGNLCVSRGQGFDPWSGKISLVAGQLRPRATTTEPMRSNYRSPQALELLVCDKKSHRNQKSVQGTTRE